MLLRLFRVPLSVVALSFCAATSASSQPGTSLPTVASINLCTDQLAILLGDPEQVLTVSSLSHEKNGSYLYEQARTITANTGSSEQILQLQPDVVLAGQFTTKATVKLLTELGLHVEIIPIENSLSQLYANIEIVSSLLKQSERGLSIVRNMKSKLADITVNVADGETDAPSAAYYDPNGYTVGPATLRGQVLQLAGWQNAAESVGIEYYGTLTLESLVGLKPDALIESSYASGTYSRGQQLLKHPALLAGGLDPTVITIPSRQTMCAGPWTIDMIELLAAKRVKIGSKAPAEPVTTDD